MTVQFADIQAQGPLGPGRAGDMCVMCGPVDQSGPSIASHRPIGCRESGGLQSQGRDVTTGDQISPDTVRAC